MKLRSCKRIFVTSGPGSFGSIADPLEELPTGMPKGTFGGVAAVIGNEFETMNRVLMDV